VQCLSCALLCCVVLCCVVLCCDVLCFALLWCAVLCCTVLCCAVLCRDAAFTLRMKRTRSTACSNPPSHCSHCSLPRAASPRNARMLRMPADFACARNTSVCKAHCEIALFPGNNASTPDAVLTYLFQRL
jgi:hypothetical protein